MVQILCAGKVARAEGLVHLHHPAGIDVCGNRYHARAPYGEDGKGHRVVPREENEVLVLRPFDDAGDLGDIAARLLDPDDVRVPRQFDHQIGLKILPRPAGDVVKDDGKVEIGELREVLDEPGTVRLVVVRTDDERAVRTRILCRPGQANRLCGVVRSGPCENRHPPVDDLDGLADHLLVLLERERRGLPGRPAGDDAVDSTLQQ
ncbi:hypothetical protein DSECCO2_629180 [anaerobic digester metagenome]